MITKMRWRLHWSLFLVTLPNFEGKEPELPLCPTNIQFFPQNLPMHCRMPTADLQNNQIPTLPPFPPQFYKSPSSGPDTQPMPIPPGIPGPMPGMMPGVVPIPGAMPGTMPIAGAMPIPMPMPGPPGHKLPVIVMPFYSPDNSFKKQPRPRPNKKFRNRKRPRPRYIPHTDSSDTDTSSNELTDSSESEGWWKGLRSRRSRSNKHHREKRRRHERRELLTPLLQYVTKDGYVIFEKKISKGEANDWLKVKEDIEVTTHSKQEINEFEDEPREIKHAKEKENVEAITERNQKHYRKKKYRLQKKVED